MTKKKKVIIAVLAVFAVVSAAVLVVGKIAVDYFFDKAYNEIIDENIKVELSQKKEEQSPSTVTGEDGEVYELAGEEDGETEEIVAKDGKTYTVKKPAEQEKPAPRIKNVSELTQKEISDIQAMVSTADKVAVINICKSAATAEDRKEVKAMLESGTLNYGRVREILSQRLSAEQKAQIYSYYEKYAAIYFGVE